MERWSKTKTSPFTIVGSCMTSVVRPAVRRNEDNNEPSGRAQVLVHDHLTGALGRGGPDPARSARTISRCLIRVCLSSLLLSYHRQTARASSQSPFAVNYSQSFRFPHSFCHVILRSVLYIT